MTVDSVEVVHLVVALVADELHFLAVEMFNEFIIRLRTIAHDDRTIIDMRFKGTLDIRRTGTCPIDDSGNYVEIPVGGHANEELFFGNTTFACALFMPTRLSVSYRSFPGGRPSLALKARYMVLRLPKPAP